MRKSLTSALTLLVALLAISTTPRVAAQSGTFQIDTQYVTGLSSPTALAFLPDGRMFVTQQSGAIRVVLANRQVLATPFMTVTTVNDQERGLLGIALDPQFATNNYVYLFYTPGAFSRVSRVTANGNVVVPNSEVTIFEYGNFSGNHRGGDIRFGPDGLLYIALGDAGEPTNSQSVASFDGKILRLNKDGSIPAGNPTTFRTTSGATVTPTGAFRAIWAMGLRNPYRFSFHPTTGAMRINDVGAGAFEEVNAGQAGANFGWPTCEGLCSNAFAVNPIYTHVRDVSNPNGGCAITGGAFQSGGQFPAQYADDYFVIDYCKPWVRNVRVDDSWGTIPVSVPIGSTDLRFAPDGSLLVIGNSSGTISRITSTGAGSNRNPVAQGTATPTSGPAPLTVAFSGAGSTDPDGDALTYAWTFGDGGVGSGVSTSHVYTSEGAFTATLTATAGRSGIWSRTFTVSEGAPPTPTITQPATGTLYTAGDTITFAGTATDTTDGTLPASAFSWTVLYHHDSHTHPVLGPLTGVRSGAFTIPRTGHPEHSVFYRIYLTVRDSSGLQTQITRDVIPRKSNVTLAANVTGAQILLDGQPQTVPHTFTSVVGIQRTIEVPSPQTIGGRIYVFSGWSDGGARSHVITAPAANQTYTATLTEAPISGNPQALTGAVARTAVTLTWAPPASQPQLVTGYIVEAGLSPGATEFTLPVGNVLSFSTAAASGRYYVRVRASTAAGQSAPSNEVTINTGQAAPPLAPQALLATVMNTNVLFEWRENPLGPEVAQYQLQAGSASGLSNLAILPLPAGSTSFFATAPAGRYFVRLVAVNAAGVSAASNEAVVTPGAGVCTVPSVPTGLVATPQPGAISLQWNPASAGAGLTSYRLEAGSVRGASDIATLTLPLTTALAGPVPRGTYFVRLAATNSCGSSATTADVTFVVP